MSVIVRCGNPECPSRPLVEDEPPNAPLDARRRCPVCGSRSRSYESVVTDVVGTISSTLPLFTQHATGHFTWAGTAVGHAPPTYPRATEAPQKLTLLGLDVTHEVLVRFSDLADEQDPYCVIEVVTGNDELLVSGIGKTPADALADVFERMLPPSSSEREGPDD